MKMLKFLMIGLFSLSLVLAFSEKEKSGLKGKISDARTGEAIPYANIVINEPGGKTIAGTSSDVNGNYSIENISPGTYDVHCNFTGYASVKLKDVKLFSDSISVQDFKLRPESQELQEVVITYEAPLIDKTKSSTITTQEDIAHMAVREISSVSAQAAGVTQGSEGKTVIRGARSEGVVYFIDGVRIEPQPHYFPDLGTEEYDVFKENSFLDARSVPLSTFSSDVDVASYANIRRFISDGQLPPTDAVRIEEMINYFSYDYPNPEEGKTFSVTTDLGSCDWAPKHQLLRIGVSTQKIPMEETPPNNLVFLIDVSGSMNHPAKLPLLKKSLNLLVDQLRNEDRVAIVVYASASGLTLPSTKGNQKEKIRQAIENLSAGGSTAGGAGIKLAYKVAEENFRKGANNRVILATDGDFNVGVSDDQQLVKLIENKRESGVFLSVLGFGSGNLKDRKMEKLADNGNGNYSYIDNLFEAQKVLVKELGSTLNVVAKDTKFQVEFNPARVQAYRLIGYENRLMPDEDFNDDTKDAGDIGSGHSVTVIYEIIPTGIEIDEIVGSVDSLKYQVLRSANSETSNEIATVKIRHKKPGERKSVLETHTVMNGEESDNADFLFVKAVTQFGLLLRDSEYKGTSNFENIQNLAKAGKGTDENGYRTEFLRLVSLSEDLAGRKVADKN